MPYRVTNVSDPARRHAFERVPVPATVRCACGRRLSGPSALEGRFVTCPDCFRPNRLLSGR